MSLYEAPSALVALAEFHQSPPRLQTPGSPPSVLSSWTRRQDPAQERVRATGAARHGAPRLASQRGSLSTAYRHRAGA